MFYELKVMLLLLLFVNMLAAVITYSHTAFITLFVLARNQTKKRTTQPKIASAETLIFLASSASTIKLLIIIRRKQERKCSMEGRKEIAGETRFLEKQRKQSRRKWK